MSRDIAARAYNRVLRPHEAWGIGVVNEPIGVFLQPGVRPRVRWLPLSKKGMYHADPFAVRKNGTLHIFCEEFDHSIGKGRIVCTELTEDSPPSEPRPAIQLPTHASYPYLLEHQGTIYCIPETYEARKIELYRAKTFPLEWERVTTLVDNFAGIDPTVFRYEDHWWLTCSDQETGPFDRLFIWHASDLFGTWIPHPANPVKVDLNSSRPAGTPFIHNGHLYRPAQDCSSTYGARVVLNRVTRITTTEFEEEAEVAVAPYSDSEYPHGLHTLSAAGSVTILDGKHIPFYNRFSERLLWRHISQSADTRWLRWP
jgi:hypothetical protein